MNKITIKILDSRLNLPENFPKFTPGNAGLDCRACIDERFTLLPGETKLVPLGFAIHLDNPNFAAYLLPRSGLGHKHGIVLGNLVGLIDSNFQGQLQASLWNRGNEPFVVQPLDRICQLVIAPVIIPQLNVVEEFGESNRGENGFGSSGVQ